MDKQESLQDKFGKLFDTVTNIPKKIADAVQEEMMEQSNLICVQKGVLDFDLIEDDVKRIHRDLKARGDRVLGSRLILDDRRDFMEILTYIERENKTFSITVSAKVIRVSNIPRQVFNQLKSKGRVELSLEL